jgi:hypothetical protein
MAPGAVLARTLAARYAPGTNLAGERAGASWRFLLPRLSLDRVLCIGAPPPASLGALSTAARQLEVTDGAHGSLPAPGAGLDLIAVYDRRAARRLARDPAFARQLEQALGADGVLYVDAPQPGGSDAALPALELRVTPGAGELETAVPCGDDELQRWFERAGLAVARSRRRPLRALERALSRWPAARAWTERRVSLAGRGVGAVPRYVFEAARESGLDLEGWRWTMSAPGRYASRKLVLFLFAPGDANPRAIAKLTRDPALNERLENEHRALAALGDKPISPSGVTPRALFLAHPGGHALVGETAIAGEPLRPLVRATRECRWTRAALDWLRALALATADGRTGNGADVAAALEQLLARLAALYPLEAAERRFLGGQLERLAALRGPLPLVFQHGDPGVWNMLATADGRVAFLDWEAAEPAGIPLWDHFYFLRSCAWSLARGRARRESLAHLERTLLADTEPARLLVESTGRYAADLGLAAEAVAPLFYSCWVHRALKEATRLPPSGMARGHYFGWLRRCIAQHDAPGLRWLAAGG